MRFLPAAEIVRLGFGALDALPVPIEPSAPAPCADAQPPTRFESHAAYNDLLFNDVIYDRGRDRQAGSKREQGFSSDLPKILRSDDDRAN